MQPKIGKQILNEKLAMPKIVHNSEAKTASGMEQQQQLQESSTVPSGSESANRTTTADPCSSKSNKAPTTIPNAVVHPDNQGFEKQGQNEDNQEGSGSESDDEEEESGSSSSGSSSDSGESDDGEADCSSGCSCSGHGGSDEDSDEGTESDESENKNPDGATAVKNEPVNQGSSKSEEPENYPEEAVTQPEIPSNDNNQVPPLPQLPPPPAVPPSLPQPQQQQHSEEESPINPFEMSAINPSPRKNGSKTMKLTPLPIGENGEKGKETGAVEAGVGGEEKNDDKQEEANDGDDEDSDDDDDEESSDDDDDDDGETEDGSSSENDREDEDGDEDEEAKQKKTKSGSFIKKHYVMDLADAELGELLGGKNKEKKINEVNESPAQPPPTNTTSSSSPPLSTNSLPATTISSSKITTTAAAETTVEDNKIRKCVVSPLGPLRPSKAVESGMAKSVENNKSVSPASSSESHNHKKVVVRKDGECDNKERQVTTTHPKKVSSAQQQEDNSDDDDDGDDESGDSSSGDGEDEEDDDDEEEENGSNQEDEKEEDGSNQEDEKEEDGSNQEEEATKEMGAIEKSLPKKHGNLSDLAAGKATENNDNTKNPPFSNSNSILANPHPRRRSQSSDSKKENADDKLSSTTADGQQPVPTIPPSNTATAAGSDRVATAAESGVNPVAVSSDNLRKQETDKKPPMSPDDDCEKGKGVIETTTPKLGLMEAGDKRPVITNESGVNLVKNDNAVNDFDNQEEDDFKASPELLAVLEQYAKIKQEPIWDDGLTFLSSSSSSYSSSKSTSPELLAVLEQYAEIRQEQREKSETRIRPGPPFSKTTSSLPVSQPISNVFKQSHIRSTTEAKPPGLTRPILPPGKPFDTNPKAEISGLLVQSKQQMSIQTAQPAQKSKHESSSSEPPKNLTSVSQSTHNTNDVTANPSDKGALFEESKGKRLTEERKSKALEIMKSISRTDIDAHLKNVKQELIDDGLPSPEAPPPNIIVATASANISKPPSLAAISNQPFKLSAALSMSKKGNTTSSSDKSLSYPPAVNPSDKNDQVHRQVHHQKISENRTTALGQILESADRSSSAPQPSLFSPGAPENKSQSLVSSKKVQPSNKAVPTVAAAAKRSFLSDESNQPQPAVDILQSMPSSTNNGTNMPSLNNNGTNLPLSTNNGTNMPSSNNNGTNMPSSNKNGTNMPSSTNNGTNLPSSNSSNCKPLSAIIHATTDPTIKNIGTVSLSLPVNPSVDKLTAARILSPATTTTTSVFDESTKKPKPSVSSSTAASTAKKSSLSSYSAGVASILSTKKRSNSSSVAATLLKRKSPSPPTMPPPSPTVNKPPTVADGTQQDLSAASNTKKDGTAKNDGTTCTTTAKVNHTILSTSDSCFSYADNPLAAFTMDLSLQMNKSLDGFPKLLSFMPPPPAAAAAAANSVSGEDDQKPPMISTPTETADTKTSKASQLKPAAAAAAGISVSAEKTSTNRPSPLADDGPYPPTSLPLTILPPTSLPPTSLPPTSLQPPPLQLLSLPSLSDMIEQELDKTTSDIMNGGVSGLAAAANARASADGRAGSVGVAAKRAKMMQIKQRSVECVVCRKGVALKQYYNTFNRGSGESCLETYGDVESHTEKFHMTGERLFRCSICEDSYKTTTRNSACGHLLHLHFAQGDVLLENEEAVQKLTNQVISCFPSLAEKRQAFVDSYSKLLQQPPSKSPPHSPEIELIEPPPNNQNGKNPELLQTAAGIKKPKVSDRFLGTATTTTASKKTSPSPLKRSAAPNIKDETTPQAMKSPKMSSIEEEFSSKKSGIVTENLKATSTQSPKISATTTGTADESGSTTTADKSGSTTTADKFCSTSTADKSLIPPATVTTKQQSSSSSSSSEAAVQKNPLKDEDPLSSFRKIYCPGCRGNLVVMRDGEDELRIERLIRHVESKHLSTTSSTGARDLSFACSLCYNNDNISTAEETEMRGRAITTTFATISSVKKHIRTVHDERTAESTTGGLKNLSKPRTCAIAKVKLLNKNIVTEMGDKLRELFPFWSRRIGSVQDRYAQFFDVAATKKVDDGKETKSTATAMPPPPSPPPMLPLLLKPMNCQLCLCSSQQLQLQQAQPCDAEEKELPFPSTTGRSENVTASTPPTKPAGTAEPEEESAAALLKPFCLVPRKPSIIHVLSLARYHAESAHIMPPPPPPPPSLLSSTTTLNCGKDGQKSTTTTTRNFLYKCTEDSVQFVTFSAAAKHRKVHVTGGGSNGGSPAPDEDGGMMVADKCNNNNNKEEAKICSIRPGLRKEIRTCVKACFPSLCETDENMDLLNQIYFQTVSPPPLI